MAPFKRNYALQGLLINLAELEETTQNFKLYRKLQGSLISLTEVKEASRTFDKSH